MVSLNISRFNQLINDLLLLKYLLSFVFSLFVGQTAAYWFLLHLSLKPEPVRTKECSVLAQPRLPPSSPVLTLSMEFSEEWKSIFSANSVFKPPLLIPSSASETHLGPLIFNPLPKTLTHLATISPSLLSPLPALQLVNFITYNCLPVSLLKSLSFQDYKIVNDEYALINKTNNLELLYCPVIGTVLAFFATGENFDRLGFVQLVIKDGTLCVKRSHGADVFIEINRFNHRITRIRSNYLPDPALGFPLKKANNKKGTERFSETRIGYLLACTTYAVHWFRVGVRGLGYEVEKPCLVYVGSKLFRSSAVVDVKWSPHLAEECIVLLESGEVFLFDINICLSTCSLNGEFKGKRIHVLWEELGSEKKGDWLGCEFAWHPRILVVARKDAVYLIDSRSQERVVSCLAEKDEFVSLSRAGADGFYFAVSSKRQLLLFDIRRPREPVLHWEHNIDCPGYLNMFSLSELRSPSTDETPSWANDAGVCILLGSFWDSEFSIFCYGPKPPTHNGPFVSKLPKFEKSLYAWGLPSELLLSGQSCRCGSCLIREEFSKDALPEWVEWQQKKDIVLGFGILNQSFSVSLSEPGDFGGFTVVRLMSSGKLESQRYVAAWEVSGISEATHNEPLIHLGNSFLRSMCDEEYKFPKKFHYIKTDYLYAHLNCNLYNLLVSSSKKLYKDPSKTNSFTIEIHMILCKKLKTFRDSQLSSNSEASTILMDVSSPTSVSEVTLRRMWSRLPLGLLQLAFSSYSEILEVLVRSTRRVSLEFMAVPDQPQLPPFLLRKPSGHSYRWTHKAPRSEVDLVGPLLPLPFLFSYHDILRGGFAHAKESSPCRYETEITNGCNEVKSVASEVAIKDHGVDLLNDSVGLIGDDSGEILGGSQSPQPFFVYKVAATPKKRSVCDEREDSSECNSTLITKLREKDSGAGEDPVGMEMFDDLNPLELKYDARPLEVGPYELKVYKLLKGQLSKWKEGFIPYQDFCNRTEYQKRNT